MKDELKNLILLLKRDEITNISTIGFIENNPITEIIEVNNSYLIKGKSDVEWIYLVFKNKTELKLLLEKCGGNNVYFASVEDWMIPFITLNRKTEWILSTMRYYLPDDIEVPENKLKQFR